MSNKTLTDNENRLLNRNANLHRSVRIDKDAIDKEKRTVEISWASETPVERWGFNEILSFKQGAVNLERLRTNAPLLLNHDTDKQIGVVEKVWIDERRGKATVRFGKSQLAEEIFQDVIDGIRSLVSVGYCIDEVESERGKDGVETITATKWEPHELSVVPIPADTTVGVGRGAEQPPTTGEQTNMRNRLLDPAPIPGGNGSATSAVVTPPVTPQPETRAANPPTISVESERNTGATTERNRISEITALGNRAKLPQERILTAINEGWTADKMRTVIFEEAYPKATPVATSSPDIGMSEREKKQYSFLRAINLLADKKALDGLEKEASDEVAKRSRKEPQGFFVPMDVQRTRMSGMGATADHVRQLARLVRALNADTATAGGYTIQESVLGDDMIELLRNKMVISKLGAMNLTGLVGDIAIPRQNGPATAYWLGENDTVSESDQTIGQVTLRPRRLAAQTAYSKQLLAQSSISVELFVRQDLMLVLALAKDLAAIAGLGAAGQPLGIMNTSGVGSLTFGATATWPKVVAFETALGQANADRGAMGFLTTPGVKGAWKTILKATGALINSSSFLWDGGKVNEYPAESTNQVPNNQVIFGNFNDLILADWDGLDVVVDPYTLAANGQVRIVEMLMTDSAIRHPVSFVVSSDAGNQ